MRVQIIRRIKMRLRWWWSLWAKALGEKSHSMDNGASDRVAILRTVIVLSYLITNSFIVAGVIRHW